MPNGKLINANDDSNQNDEKNRRIETNLLWNAF